MQYDLEGNKLPLLGINIGTLGYLADVELKDYKSAINRLSEEEPKVEKRMMLEGQCHPVKKIWR